MDYSQPSCAPHLPAAQGALLKDTDLVRWLQNKLQDREKWAGREAVQLVSREMIEELMTCFSFLENPTKLKIILSFLYLGPAKSKQWKDTLVGMLNMTRRDADDWVEVISELFRSVPMAEGTKVTIDDHASYQKMLDDLKQIAEEREDAGDLRTDPPSTDICSKDVIIGLYEKESAVQKHFALRKKPKSETLLAEMRKQCDVLNNQKKDRKEAITSGCLPIKIRSTRREANNSLPMRGIPNQNTVKMSQGFSNEPKKFSRPLAKREGGVKLLDIGELPPSLKQRRQAEREDEQRKAKEEKERQKKVKEVEKKAEAEAKRQALLKAKEDAERKILREKKAPKADTQKINESKRPDSFNLKRPAPEASTEEQPPRMANTQQGARSLVQQQSFVQSRDQPILQPRQMHQQEMHQQEMQHQLVPQMSQVPQQQPLHHQRPIQQYQQMQSIQHQSQQPYNPNIQRPVIVQNYPGNQAIQIPGSSQMQQQQHTYIIAAPQSGPVVEFQDLEVARKCQEILQSANALDDKGRDVVIQFMKGGLRCAAPTQNMSHIMTLKLSENIEDGLVDGRLQKLKVEVFFQMDLSNGEWKRLRKCRVLEGDEMIVIMNQQQQQQQQHWQSQQYNPQRY